jgi:heme/copper-type cytochrome/quinol oxidase subunit 1
VTLHFAPAVWQAGIGEVVVAIALSGAAVSGRILLGWIGFWFSVLGIVVGLSSHQVQGAARDIHVVLVPLAIVVLVLLIASRRSNRLFSSPSR